MPDSKIERGVRCKSPEEITQWRKDKILLPYSLDKSPNFGSKHSELDYEGGDTTVGNTITKEKWHLSVSLKKGIYTDQGYRYRYHLYNRTDKDYFSPALGV